MQDSSAGRTRGGLEPRVRLTTGPFGEEDEEAEEGVEWSNTHGSRTDRIGGTMEGTREGNGKSRKIKGGEMV